MGNEAKLVIYGHSMGTGVGARAVAECTRDKSVRVDGLILDSPMHSIKYALKSSPNFYYYSSFIFDWQKFMEVAGLEFNTPKVKFSYPFYLNCLLYFIKTRRIILMSCKR